MCTIRHKEFRCENCAWTLNDLSAAIEDIIEVLVCFARVFSDEPGFSKVQLEEAHVLPLGYLKRYTDTAHL